MKLHSLLFRSSLLLFVIALMLAAPRASAQAQNQAQTDASVSQASALQTPVVPARITQAIDETQLVTLKGNVHPLARPEFDQGAVATSMPLQRMLLLLKRSQEQESGLLQLLSDQQNANSSNYHKWLTPEQFGAQFGPADADVQTAVSWLQSHGFQVAKVSKGKLAIEFSGTAAQVKEAFHTEIHRFAVNGERHLAIATDPQIPAALFPVVRGPAALNDFRPKPMHRVFGEFTKSSATSEVKAVNPEMTTTSGCGTGQTQPCYALGPTDFATIYNVLPLWNAASAIDGTGVSIAVVGVSNINLQDVTDFRTLFALPTGGAANTPKVTIDGADPGIVNDGSETEALLDTEWSGAVAKGAQIHFVAAADTDANPGLILAMLNVVDNNSDPILNVSFGNCEAVLGSNNTQFFVPLWEQAAAQGITVTVSTGDDGSAGCEDQNAPAPNPATTGLQVSGYASTPFNVAVGGTDFNDAGTQLTYFNAASDATTLDSAKGYIPESTWNESCTNASFGANPETNCNAAANSKAVVTVGGSGGASTVSVKPAFQQFISAAHGMPADGARDLPDVSLFASSGFNSSFYVVCEADAVSSPSCQKGSQFHFLGVGGTSASAPSFAGIMALVNQKTGQRQGNANFVIYKLAQQQFAAGTACASVASPLPNSACTFNDVTTGTIAMPCSKGSTNCNPTTGADTIGVLSGYSAGAGYDLATGLGSVNANNLVSNWANGVAAFTGTTTTLSLSPTTGITAGQSVTVNVTVARNGGSGTPSGDVALVSTAQTGDGVAGFTLDSSGKVVNGTTTQLTGGGPYQVTARYSGDGTFAPSVSTPVMVTVSKASSTTTADVLSCPTLNTCVSVAGGSGTAPVTLFLRAIVSPTNVVNNSQLTPTGTVTFLDNGSAIAGATNVLMDQSGEAFTAGGISSFAAGNHSIKAQYSGDPSYTVSTSAAVAFTLTGGTSPTITSLNPTSGAVGTSVTITGTNFGATQGTSTVKFNGTAATPTTWSATSIVAPVPTGATTGTVVVTVGGTASNGVTFTVTTGGGTFTVSGAAVTVTAGSSGMSNITVTPSGGFTGIVNVTCGTTIPGVTCTPNPLAINIVSASPVASNLTVAIAANSSSLSASAAPLDRKVYAAALAATGGANGWWGLSAGAGLAAIVLLVLPGRRRYRTALALASVCVLSIAMGCGGGYGGNGGPSATTTHLTVSATKVAATGTLTVSATVNSTGSHTPTGSVQFYDGTTALGGPVTLTNGSTGQINLTAAQAPAFFQLIGTHTAVNVKYLADTYNSGSQSGNLSITITGTTNLPITGTSGSTNVNGNISLTIN